MGVTIPELAKLCGVSRGTIDRALNNRPGINEKTREYILHIARENGYKPNTLARSLVTGKTNTVGIILFDFRNRHFAQLVNSIESHLTSIGYTCYICISEKNKHQEFRIVHDLISRNVEGIIIMPINHPEDFEKEFGQYDIPIVAVNNRLTPRYSYVGGDFASAAYDAMEHFYQHGYRYVSFVCPSANPNKDENASAQTERSDGYLNFLKTHPDMKGSFITDYNFMDIIQQDLKVISHPGYFCGSDYYALQIRLEAKKLGLKIPQDFGLMGFDGVDTLDYIDQPIDTINYPTDEVGSSASRLLEQLMNGSASPQNVLVPLSLRKGESI